MSDKTDIKVDLENTPKARTAASNLQLIYILYIASLLIGVTAVFGFLWALFADKDVPAWLKSHYTYVVHTFWKGAIYFVVGFLLIIILIGFPIIILAAVWWIVRCVKGLIALSKKQPIINPERWTF